MKLTLKLIPLLLISLVLLTACGSATPSPEEVNAVMTAGVETIVASIFGTQTAMASLRAPIPSATLEPLSPTAVYTLTSAPTPSSTSTPVYIYPTATTFRTSTPSLVPLATGTHYTATVAPGALAFGCNNLAFIRDVTLPSGTAVNPGESITKTWKVANNGTCDWLYQYSLELLSANYHVGGSVKLGHVVAMNHWAEISVNLDVPRNPGTYTSYWRLSDGAGHMFGSTLQASFVVGQPTATPGP